jgi:hypothetical protein
VERSCFSTPWSLWKDMISNGKIKLCKTLLNGNC